MAWQNNYIPKDATQQDIFLSKYPEFDGRGIKIAIIDSGLDISLKGLRCTSEGLPKIIDCFDFTGVGDVDTSVIREMENNILDGLNGRKLKIPKHWKNPSGKWHLGLKSIFKPKMPSLDSEKLPEIDCIVWFDGRKWCACIETYANLEEAKILTNFRDEHDYSILHLDKLEMSYCITVHNDGNLLEIFMPYGDHGTIVTQTAAAHFPENRDSDGLAPGAQIIFMSIWGPEKDTDEMFVQTLNKALLKCLELNVDIINCSFRSFYGDERITKSLNKMVKQCNTLIFTSAGNRGPFYGTIYGCDSCVENVVFRIGSALTFEIKKRFYNVQPLNCHPPIIYHSSSRGPGAMGSQGLDFTAPGAVITDTPHFSSLKRGEHFATSFASANAAGAVACLLSALKANSIKYSPKSIKFVLTKTANLPKNRDKFEFGHGIIQINDAFDYYCNHANIDFNDKIPNHLPSAGGFYFDFLQNDDDPVTESEINLSQFIEIEPGKAVAENWTLEVSPKFAESYIEIQSKIDKNNKFNIKIDAKQLKAGSLNFAEIMVMDSEIGSICNIPVNVIHVLKIDETHNYRFKKEITLNFENPYYLFFNPCFKSDKKCEIKITALENSIQCIQYMVGDARGEETVKTINFIPKFLSQTHSFSIRNKTYKKFCIFQMPGALSHAIFNLEFYFFDL